ncbi:MAG: TetR/AcrR family transcriptional regulator [Clostridia bacterium]|nr:TetR/AcrR family transcriptional regulator [Clostridia bacterium]
MPAKTDLRIIKSQRAIKKAFLELINEKGYANITITDIAKKAMINRKTFYIHYETKEILYNNIVDEFFEILSPALDSLQYLRGISQRKHIITLLLQVKEHKDVFNILYNDSTNTEFINKLKIKFNYDLISKAHIDEKTKNTHFTFELLSEAYFSLFMTFVQWWVNTSDDVSANEVVDMIIEFFSKKTLEILGINFNDYDKKN